MRWVLTGTETSDTSCRSFLGQNNNIEMGYHLKIEKKSKLGHPILALLPNDSCDTQASFAKRGILSCNTKLPLQCTELTLNALRLLTVSY